MPTRVTLCRGDVSKIAALPDSFEELCTLATKKLGLEQPALRFFSADARRVRHSDHRSNAIQIACKFVTVTL